MDCGGSPLIGCVVYLCLLVVDFCISAFVSGLDNLNETLLQEDVEDGKKNADKIASLMDRYSLVRDGLFFWIGLSFLITGAYAVPAIASNYADESGHVSIITYIILLVVAYSIYAIFHFAAIKVGGAKEEKAAYALYGFCNVLIMITVPFCFVYNKMSGLVVRFFGADPNKNLDEVSEDEIISMVNEGHEQGLIESSEAEMIHNIFEFTDTEAQDIMTHRKNMVIIDGALSFKEALKTMLDSSNSRFPVYMEDSDNIVGVVHIRDCMERMQEAKDLDRAINDMPELIRDVSFIPETRKIGDLFRQMQEEKSHLVIVVDEYGQTSGLVTLEDILEEIVGNIFDEYDEEEEPIHTEDDGSYMIEGKTPLDEVEEILDIELPKEDYDTLNGYLISLIDRIPADNEQITVLAEGYQFDVVSVENKMIQRVHVVKLPEPVDSSEEEE